MKNFARRVVKGCPPVYRLYNRLRGWRIHTPDSKIAYIDLGGDKGTHNYGAWVAPANLLDARSTVYSVGIGDDISFDLDVIRRYGCKVYAFDPTPIAARFVERTSPDPRFIFSKVGLSTYDGTAHFIELNATNMGMIDSTVCAGREALELPVNRLSTLMARNGHERINLLKMDIEGGEYGVIDDMLATGILPVCIVVEFHHYLRKDPESTRRAVRKLKKVGYKLFWVSELGAEYGFCLRSAAE